jgi:hypothetical protein
VNRYGVIWSMRSTLDPTAHVHDPAEPVPSNEVAPRVEPTSVLVQIRFKTAFKYLQTCKIHIFRFVDQKIANIMSLSS